jgi:hypothetical protein
MAAKVHKMLLIGPMFCFDDKCDHQVKAVMLPDNFLAAYCSAPKAMFK